MAQATVERCHWLITHKGIERASTVLVRHEVELVHAVRSHFGVRLDGWSVGPGAPTIHACPSGVKIDGQEYVAVFAGWHPNGVLVNLLTVDANA